MSNSLRPHEPQHARLPCPSPPCGVYSSSCPLSWWCHPTILSSVYTPIQNKKLKKKKNSGFGLRITMNNPSLCQGLSVTSMSCWTSLSFHFLNSKMGRVTKAILLIFTGLKVAYAKHLAGRRHPIEGKYYYQYLLQIVSCKFQIPINFHYFVEEKQSGIWIFCKFHIQ